MFETWDAQKRLTEAKRVTKSVVDHTLYLLWIHEQNELVLFSDILSKQIPRSRAVPQSEAARSGLGWPKIPSRRKSAICGLATAAEEPCLVF
jgi:hypothetical protein